MSLNFEELLDKNLSTVTMKPGSLLTGIVIDILDSHVIVYVGLKSEAAIAIQEFVNEKGEIDLKVGDEVQLLLEAIEDGHGNTRVSREKAIKQEVWKRIEDCLKGESTLNGLITGQVKGGMTVDIQGIKAFLPGSLAEATPTKDLDHLEGRYEEFKVIKLDKEKNNVVLSRRAVLEEVNSEEREKLLSNLEEGQEIQGVVKNLTDYGAFIDLGGIDGLLHITDISWSRKVCMNYLHSPFHRSFALRTLNFLLHSTICMYFLCSSSTCFSKSSIVPLFNKTSSAFSSLFSLSIWAATICST